jgi:hypothetical protein
VQKYDAWPKGLNVSGGSGVEIIIWVIINMAQEVRKIAQQKVRGIKNQKNLLDRIGFNFGYFLGPNMVVKSFCTSNRPINPFIDKNPY